MRPASRVKLLVAVLAGLTATVALVGLSSELSPVDQVQSSSTEMLMPDEKAKAANTRFVLKPASPGTLNIHVFPNADKKSAVVQMVKDLASRVRSLSKFLIKMKKSIPTRGPPGSTGEKGERGPPGAPGLNGRPGNQGDPGLVGPPGPPGKPGVVGKRGHQGETGERGKTGPRGLPGRSGPIGNRGPPGTRGVPGPAGPQGPHGHTGPSGSVGEKGPPGSTGPRGFRGVQGKHGPKGLPGPRGYPGASGPAGPPGPAGLTTEKYATKFKSAKLLTQCTALHQRRAKVVSATDIASAKSWTYMMWYRPEQNPTGHWRSLFHKGKHDRIRAPGVWFNPRDMGLHVRVATAANWNDGCDPTEHLRHNQWTHISFTYSDRTRLFRVLFNNHEVCRKELKGVLFDSTSPLYIGDPWYAPAYGRVANFYYVPHHALDVKQIQHYSRLNLKCPAK